MKINMADMRQNAGFVYSVVNTIARMRNNIVYHICLWIFGFFTMTAVLISHRFNDYSNLIQKRKREILKMIRNSETADALREEIRSEIECKDNFFGTFRTEFEIEQDVEREFEITIQELALEHIQQDRVFGGVESGFNNTLKKLLNNKLFLIFSLIFSLPMYILIGIYNNAYVKYVFERLFMMIFVLLGVTIVVFTIIYISPTDPAASVLGPDAPAQTVENFRKAYGLTDPYLKQLWSTFRRVVTFDLGSSYIGNENIAKAIARKFPITFNVGLASLGVALLIAMPAGIISAMKQYSGFDYLLMFVALLGLSVPNFWLGLILILQFSIKRNWLPAMFQVGNLLTIIMPAIVVGTGMSASLARMTRSSMLEVARQDYVTMARAKGLSESKVVLRHILKNALLPIITIIGMQFAAVLSGAATTEKVFNIKGMCEYISSRTLLPDTPVVIGGVIYIATAISISNLIVDIIYTFIDPRIKTRLDNY